MGKLLFGVITWALSGVFARIITSAGIAILGSVTFGQFINYFLDKAILQLSQIQFVGLIGLAGIDKAISIYLTAVMIKIYLLTVIQSVKLVKK